MDKTKQMIKNRIIRHLCSEEGRTASLRLNRDFSKICTPAKIYFAIAVIASVIALFSGAGVMMVAMKLIFAFIWTFVLGWLCDQGFQTLSWFLVLLPYIFIALAMFGVYQMTHDQRQLMRSVKMQGAYGQEPMKYNM